MAMKLDHEDLNHLIDKISTSDIQEFSLEGEDFKLEIKRNLVDQNQVINNLVSNTSFDRQTFANEKTFRAGESVQQAILEKSNLQHTYVESGDYVFMDMTSFEETRLSSEQIGKGAKYLKEGMEVNVIFHNGKVLEVELPISITLKVTETDPGVKGDTASGGTKPAILETGAQVMVPLFISVGEMIRVDTRNDSYLGREN